MHYDEDCLFLNIWTPSVAISSNSSLPVMLFIHGGGFDHGSGNLDIYASSNLVSNNGLNGIVAVTINYRLGPLG